MRRVSSWRPGPKVAGSGMAGAAATVVVWLLTDVAHLQVPGAVSSAIGVIVTMGVAYLIPGGQIPDRDVDERPLTDDERQRVVETYNWFAPQRDEQNGG